MSSNAEYSLTWARSVVGQFEAKHARASEFYKAVYSISSKDLAVYIAKRDPFWEEFKKLCKVLERLHPDGQYGDPDRMILCNARALSQRLNISKMDQRLLTRLQNLAKLKELDEKQGVAPVAKAKGVAPYLNSSHFPGSEHQLCFDFA